MRQKSVDGFEYLFLDASPHLYIIFIHELGRFCNLRGHGHMQGCGAPRPLGSAYWIPEPSMTVLFGKIYTDTCDNEKFLYLFLNLGEK